MPLIELRTTAQVPPEKRDAFAASLSKLLAAATGKPESYVMVTIEKVDGCFAGKSGPMAFADIRGIGGFSKKVNTAVTRELCALLKSELAVPSESVYCTFQDIPAVSWGWNNSVFG